VGVSLPGGVVPVARGRVAVVGGVVAVAGQVVAPLGRTSGHGHTLELLAADVVRDELVRDGQLR
jgi:hypothetical protein